MAKSCPAHLKMDMGEQENGLSRQAPTVIQQPAPMFELYCGPSQRVKQFRLSYIHPSRPNLPASAVHGGEGGDMGEGEERKRKRVR